MTNTVANCSPKPLSKDDAQDSIGSGSSTPTPTQDGLSTPVRDERNSLTDKNNSECENMSNGDIQTPKATQVSPRLPSTPKASEEVDKPKEKSGKIEKPQKSLSEKRSLPSRRARSEAASKLTSSLSSSKDTEETTLSESEKKGVKRSLKESNAEGLAKRALLSKDNSFENRENQGISTKDDKFEKELKQTVLSKERMLVEEPEEVFESNKNGEKVIQNSESMSSPTLNQDVAQLNDASPKESKSPEHTKSQPLKGLASSPKVGKLSETAIPQPLKETVTSPKGVESPEIVFSEISNSSATSSKEGTSPERAISQLRKGTAASPKVGKSPVTVSRNSKSASISPKGSKSQNILASQPSKGSPRQFPDLYKPNGNDMLKIISDSKDKAKPVLLIKSPRIVAEQPKQNLVSLQVMKPGIAKKHIGSGSVKVISRTVCTQTDDDNPLFKPLILKILNSDQKLQTLSGFSSFEVLDSLTDATLKMITNNQSMISDLGPCLREWIIITCVKFLLNLSIEVLAVLFELDLEECNQIVQKTSRFLRKSLVLPMCQSFVRDMPLSVLNGIADCTDMQENGSR